MMDRISEMIAVFLVALGQQLMQLTPQQKRMITLFLASLFVAALAARVLRLAVLGH